MCRQMNTQGNQKHIVIYCALVRFHFIKPYPNGRSVDDQFSLNYCFTDLRINETTGHLTLAVDLKPLHPDK